MRTHLVATILTCMAVAGCQEPPSPAPQASSPDVALSDKSASAPLSADEARAIAKEAFLWGMHPVALYHQRYNQAQNEHSPKFVGLNRLSWYRKPLAASDRFATTPNATTLYGTAMLDLSKGPVVITVPDIKARYWSIQFADNYARWWPMALGSQFDPPGPMRRVIVGPEWHGQFPTGFAGTEILQSPSDYAVVTARVALTDDTQAELEQVNAVQDGITLMPLDQWNAGGRKPVRAEDVPLVRAAYPTYPGMDQVKEPGKLKGVDFLRWVSLVLDDPTFAKQADSRAETDAFKRFERLGLKPGVPFDPNAFPDDIKAAIAEGVEDGRKQALALMEKGSGIDMNGWSLQTDLGYRDSDWTARARNGLVAVLAPVPFRSHTGAFAIKDSEGQPFSGEHRYTITFDMKDLPPVTEFWEIPIYDRDGYFIDNPINRYSINSYMLQRGKLHAADGKLVIYVQADAPTDPQQRQNWLPAPSQGGFQFAARFYGPKGPLIDGSYDMPQVVRTD
jgi:hypothetical protein